MTLKAWPWWKHSNFGVKCFEFLYNEKKIASDCLRPIDLNLFWTLLKALGKPQAFYFRMNKSGWFDLVFLWMWAYLPRLESRTAEGNDGVGEEVNGARRKRKKSQKGQNKITIGLPTFSNGVHESNHQVTIIWLRFRMTAPLAHRHGTSLFHFHISLSHTFSTLSTQKDQIRPFGVRAFQD